LFQLTVAVAEAEADGVAVEERDESTVGVALLVTGGLCRNDDVDEEEGVDVELDVGTALADVVAEAEEDTVAEAEELPVDEAVLLVVPLAVGVAVGLPTTQKELVL